MPGSVAATAGGTVGIAIGLALLAISTLAFAYAQSLSTLFAARLVQGAADGITWVVGFAMIALVLFAVMTVGSAEAEGVSGAVLNVATGRQVTVNGLADAIGESPRATWNE